MSKMKKPQKNDTSDNDTLVALGRRIKDLRLKRKYTLQDLSDKTGVSRAMISNIERAEKSPTLSVIVRVAQGFDISLSDLLGAETNISPVSIVRKEDRITFLDEKSGFRRDVLSPPGGQSNIELLQHAIPPGRSTGLLPRYTYVTHKYIVVLRGNLTLNLNENRYEVGEGDTLYFEIRAPYSFENHGSETVNYLITVVRNT
jgi:transcriptional regulator with XRE-family HTH domain